MEKLKSKFQAMNWGKISSRLLIILSSIISIMSTIFFYQRNAVLAYGDAAQHLNIAKRVIDGLTPGFGQLGSVWLPLQHLMLIPFVWNDFLYRSGLGGSFLSMICFVLTSLIIFKIVRILNGSILAALLASFIFMSNPNILYMQSTPMGEIPLMLMLTASVYFLIFWSKTQNFSNLILAGFFASLASLIRYDGWFLVATETVLIVVISLIRKIKIKEIESSSILFAYIAYTGIIFWLLWNLIIFGSPTHFMTSQYSARAQQIGWQAQGLLPTYKNLFLSTEYYLDAIVLNSGWYSTILATIGSAILSFYFIFRKKYNKIYFLALAAPFPFYIFSLFIGNAIIFLPNLTPEKFHIGLFNVRYGLMLLPYIAVVGGLITFNRKILIALVFLICVFQFYTLVKINNNVVTYVEGTTGIASRSRVGINPTEKWINNHYDNGLVLLNTYFGSVDIINLRVPLKDIIYEGSNKYWQISLVHPSTYAKWIILKKDNQDPLWHAFNKNKEFYNNFKLVYEDNTSAIYLKKNK